MLILLNPSQSDFGDLCVCLRACVCGISEPQFCNPLNKGNDYSYCKGLLGALNETSYIKNPGTVVTESKPFYHHGHLRHFYSFMCICSTIFTIFCFQFHQGIKGDLMWLSMSGGSDSKRGR